MKFAALIFLLSAPAFASESATVTLTQDQLTRLIQSETAKAVSSYISQEKSAAAKDAYDAVEKAFAPKPEAKPEPAPKAK